MRVRSLLVCLGALSIAAPVRAEDAFSNFEPPPPAPVNPYSYAWRDDRMLSRIGIGFTAGAGATGFSAAPMRDLVSESVGGLWSVRASIGTHIPLGGELTYVGSAAKLRNFSDAYSGMLIGTAVEAVARYTILPLADGTPYAFAGVGWQHFRVRDSQPALSDTGMRLADNLAEFPMGLGAQYRDRSGWIGDVRATFRAAMDSGLVTQADGSHARLHSWEASAAFGYEF